MSTPTEDTGAVSAGTLRIKHWLTFTGPAFVPTSTDETSARETTGATLADVGADPSDAALTPPEPASVDNTWPVS